MFRRILLNAAPVEGGAVETVPVSITPDKPAATKPEPAKSPEVGLSPSDYVKLTRELEELRTQKAEFEKLIEKAKGEERAKYEAEIAKSESALKSLGAMKDQFQSDFEKLRAEREKTENEWKQRYEDDTKKLRESAEAKERDILSEKKANAIAQAMLGREFAGATPEAVAEIKCQVETLLSLRFEAKRDESGKVVVRDTKSGKFVSEVASVLLDGHEFAHFIKAKSSGGSGAIDKGAARDVTPIPGSDDGMSPGEKLVNRLVAAQREKKGSGAQFLPSAGFRAPVPTFGK